MGVGIVGLVGAVGIEIKYLQCERARMYVRTRIY